MIRLSRIRHRFSGTSASDREAFIERYLLTSGRNDSPMFRVYMDREWRLHEGDLRLPGNVVNDLYLIVTGDLIVDGWYDDSCDDESFTAVFGSMRCQHIFSSHDIFVGGDLRAQGLIYLEERDWNFECPGEVSARAFIGKRKEYRFDSARAVFEGRLGGPGDASEEGPNPYRLLGFDLKDGEEAPNWEAVTRHVKAAEAEGRSPFVIPEPAATAPWREALHPATGDERLAELAALAPWEITMRPRLAPPLQALLSRCADPRVRWAAASAPWAGEAALRGFAADPEPAVRAAAALREDCLQDLRRTFAADPAPEVRAAVVYAHGTCKDGACDAAWLPPLAADVSPIVRRAVAAVPDLPADIVGRLLNDADGVVRKRASRSPHAIRALFDSPDEETRRNLARAAAHASEPFSCYDDEALSLETLSHLMLDPSPQVRSEAAVSYLSPRYYENNAERFATDEVEDARHALAFWTRQATWLTKLSTDPSENVRWAVAKNPNTPAAVLIRMARQAATETETRSRVPEALEDNPRLPAEARKALYGQDNQPDAGPIPHDPVLAMILRERADSSCKEGDRECAAFERCLSFFADGRQPSDDETAELFRFMIFEADVESICSSALASAACPPHILSLFVDHFLRAPQFVYHELEEATANPSLPLEAIHRLTAFMMRGWTELEWETRSGEEWGDKNNCACGLVRNPSVPAEVLARLVLNEGNIYFKNMFVRALWDWHDVAEEEITGVWPDLLAEIR